MGKYVIMMKIELVEKYQDYQEIEIIARDIDEAFEKAEKIADELDRELKNIAYVDDFCINPFPIENT